MRVKTTSTASSGYISVPPLPVDLRLDGGYIVARCGASVAVYELVWESRHGEPHRRLTLRRCESVPRQFERELFNT